MLAQRKRIVRPQGHLVLSHQVEQESQRGLVVHQRVEIEAAEVLSRRLLTVDGAEVGPYMKAVLDAADGTRECASTVRKTDAQALQPIEHSRKQQRRNCQRGFRRHTDEPAQPVLGHAVFTHHVPGVHEHRSPKVSRTLQHRHYSRVVQVAAVHVCADLHARKTQLFHAPLEFLHGEVRGLHWDRAEPYEPLPMGLHHAGEVVVQQA